MRKFYIFVTIVSLFSINKLEAQTANSLNFDGTNDEINCGNDPSVQITGTNITIEAIIKIHSFRTNVWEGNIVNKEEAAAGGGNGYMLRVGDAGIVNFNLGSPTWNELNSPANTVITDTWYHIAATYDGSQMLIYVDGVEVASQNVSISILNSVSNLYIGNWALGGGRHINATMDEVRLWNITRTGPEIVANMNTSLTLPQTGLVAYYKFNQGVANGDNSTETTLNDELVDNNGTLSNFTLNGGTSNWVDDTALSVPEFFHNTIKLYPNPSNDFIQISGFQQTENYKILNVLGANILNGTISQNQKLSIQSLSKGVYFIKFDNGFIKKFIKK